MNRIQILIKIPKRLTEVYSSLLKKHDVSVLTICSVPYEKFIRESRLNWDYVFPEMRENKQAVDYLSAVFDETEENRKIIYQLEIDLKQIPLNISCIQ
jgi:hypothetical protein